MSHEDLICRQQDGILTITFNRPNKKNALDKAMYQAINEALLLAENDLGVRAVLIRGQASAFTAGNDLNDFNVRKHGEKSSAIVLLETLHQFEKPIVAAVAGVAVGIGVTMLLHMDLVYASPETRFRMPFINLGVVPEGASSLLLPMRIGHQRAAKLLMLGDFFTAREAVEFGIASEEVPLDDLFEHAESTALRLSKLPAQAMQTTKNLMKQSLKDEISETIGREAKLFSQMIQTEESQALRNAAQKR